MTFPLLYTIGNDNLLSNPMYIREDFYGIPETGAAPQPGRA